MSESRYTVPAVAGGVCSETKTQTLRHLFSKSLSYRRDELRRIYIYVEQNVRCGGGGVGTRRVCVYDGQKTRTTGSNCRLQLPVIPCLRTPLRITFLYRWQTYLYVLPGVLCRGISQGDTCVQRNNNNNNNMTTDVYYYYTGGEGVKTYK